MVETLNREYLKKNLDKLRKNDTGKALDVLPFLTKRTKVIRTQFNEALGEYVRCISGFQLNKKVRKSDELYFSEEGNELAESIANEVEFKEEDDKYDFIRFLNQFLFNQENIKPIHPFLFNYMKIDKHENEFEKYADFMSQVLVKENQEIQSIFNNKDSEDILTELILSKMDVVHEEKNRKGKKKRNQYQPLLDSLSNLYQEDLIYLSKYKDYFLTTFPILTHFYTFMYACQLIIKFEQFTEADMNSTQPLYFALDWESMSKRRKAADELEGFKYIKEKSINIFPHIHAISHLSHNSFNSDLFDEEDKEKKIRFIPYSRLYELIKSEGEEYEAAFLKELKQWIQEYLAWASKDVLDDSENIPEAFKVFFRCLKEGTSTGVAKKFGENIEDLGSPFIKSRGNLGQILNIKHDFLLLLTAVSVKDKRIPLNELFVEFEKRGIVFDRYSKKEIITLLDNHNILDKKSDSGDAQYVKPIL
ncbi:DNA phosphorothioation-dependent restriction protein DptG [Peribacillus asahii]|uniref:DNA phosphorothioation-dependent restriction protein DptG n=1 Tax=Peribacillus asahii TaxID=228899 RepID=UPI00207AFCAD|nr:DNA phosphorothioation-dependent restriction protein DptG [Peribacillus asahii]USK86060.1 DNA phosphorothioation-dependent restriction protein DptG [Peribacillus asahii]